MKKDTIAKIKWSADAPVQKEFEGYKFEHCDFSQANLSSYRFIDCEFSDCNFTMAKLFKASFQECFFSACKLSGCRFDQCTPFLLSFNCESCIMDHAVFSALKLQNMKLHNCRLHGSDFTNAQLLQLSFDGSDLHDAQFDGTLLDKCDFRTAQAYRIHPDLARIKKSKFSLHGLPGLLTKYDLIIE